MEIAHLYQLFTDSSGVTTDTRNIKENSLYFALKGARFNGNVFAQEALDKGASYAIIDEEAYTGPRKLLVKDVLHTLQELAKHHRKQLSIPVIGLTGSNGKTTTKELMHAALSARFNTLATKGNLNNHIGVPLTLLSINPTHEMAIVEMGANHQKEIEFLSGLCQPNIGYITNYGKAHLEGFGGVQGIIKGKSELYDNLRLNKQTALINLSDPIQVDKTRDLAVISFGAGGDYVFAPLHFGKENFIGLKYADLEVETKLTGSYNYSNLCAAFALALHFEVDPQKAAKAISDYTPGNNRSQFKKTKNNQLLLDAYNANPSSMEVALQNFREIDAPHKWVILGDMFELGEEAEAEHKHIAELACTYGFDKVLLAGEQFAALPSMPGVLQFANTEALAAHLENNPPSEKAILIKGSRGMKLEQLVAFL